MSAALRRRRRSAGTTACSSGAIEPSHVLTAMGLSGERARASIRFSLGKQTTEEDIDFVIERVPETVAKLRELSPLWKGSAQQSALSIQP